MVRGASGVDVWGRGRVKDNVQMSANSSASTIVYLAQGNLRIKAGTAAPRTLESTYGNSLREKEVRAQQKNSWKSSGNAGSFFSGPALWGKAAMQQDVPMAITSICGGKTAGELVYSLESGSLCALLEATSLGAEERRLWNDNRTRIRHLNVSRPTGDLTFSVLHENGTANIGLKLNGEGGIKEMTEGDSFDTAPRWVPGGGQRIVFQSAGIGRNREGQFLALGPFSIEELDVQNGEMKTVAEDARHDYLAPQGRADGALYYIRRPYTRQERLHPLRLLTDILLFPFRLGYAIFHILNFLSAMFSGRQLTSNDSAKSRKMDMRQMMIWGNLVQAQRKVKVEEEGIDLVPKSWELCRQEAGGEAKVMANGVLAYDVAEDGTLVYTNGNALFLLHPDGRKERLLNENMIEQVFFVPE